MVDMVRSLFVPKCRVSDDSPNNNPLTRCNWPPTIARLIRCKDVLKNTILSKVSRGSKTHI